MSGHTKGPWAVNPVDARVDAFATGVPLPVCALLWPTAERSEAETEANGRLIAAAPELLAELEREYETLADIRNEWPGRNTSKSQAKLCRLRDLIAKATGRAPKDVQDDFSMRAALIPFTGAQP